MGYDFLGTMGLNQWNKLKAFTDAHIEELAGEDSAYVKHLFAEIIKSERLLVDLQIANVNFANFEGDVAFRQEMEKPVGGPVFNYGDSDTSVYVSDIKDLLKPLFKRKKDNLEYRIKKARDMVEQLSIRASLWMQGLELADARINRINNHFKDGLHKHNLTQGDIFDAHGNVKHNPGLSVIVEKSGIGDKK